MTERAVETHTRRKFIGTKLILLSIILGVILAACGNSPATPAAVTHMLTVIPAPGQPITDLFNPYFNTNGGSDYGTQGYLYETLLIQNLYSGQITNWLASSYTFSADQTTLTFHMRLGVKWSDGKDLTADDVAFTFNLMNSKANSALDSGALWATTLKSVTATDSSTVVFTLQHPDSSAVFTIGSSVFIVPQHIWQSVSDPVKFANDQNPVVSGPFLLHSRTAQLITYVKNPGFWGTKPEVDKILVPTVKDNSTAILDMAKGTLDWLGSAWDPTLDPSFVGKDPTHNHHWFTPSNTVMLYMNLQKPLFQDLNVRKAISLAINRPGLQQNAAAYAPPANPSGILLPNWKQWVAPAYQGKNFTNDTQQAESLLQQSGYAKGSDGIYAKGGQKLSFKLTVVNGWFDWDSDTQNISNDLKAIGIDAQINTVTDYPSYMAAMQGGTFDAGISWTNSGPTPYFPFSGMLSSANSAPPGQNSSGTNFERWSDPQTDQLLQQYRSASDDATKQQAIAGLEDIIANKVPVIPLTYNPYWSEYSTKHFTGWPDANNPYDVGSPYSAPDNENVVLHLKAVS